MVGVSTMLLISCIFIIIVGPQRGCWLSLVSSYHSYFRNWKVMITDVLFFCFSSYSPFTITYEQSICPSEKLFIPSILLVEVNIVFFMCNVFVVVDFGWGFTQTRLLGEIGSLYVIRIFHMLIPLFFEIVLF